MSQADDAYYMRRVHEEQAHAEQAKTHEARSSHEKLHELYLLQLGGSLTGPGIKAHANEQA